ncbi:hypothetical protein E2C01_084089 [Portunus trituberculatus]|uniref:Uncharacterized protein n=1 Tax=Portunus trituberculatus TaxID=210409 RepID=A0A5B7J9R3_PORTR|nr:hypothetical protein [Portunus trituberculatus]
MGSGRWSHGIRRGSAGTTLIQTRCQSQGLAMPNRIPRACLPYRASLTSVFPCTSPRLTLTGMHLTADTPKGPLRAMSVSVID